MNEIEAIHWHLSHYRERLGQQIDRVYNALEELQRTTLLLIDIYAKTADETIDDWLKDQDFAVDADGFHQSQPLLAAHRKGLAPLDAISVSWDRDLQQDPLARSRMYSHRQLGPHLRRIHERLGQVGWIYYQDAGNTSLQYPFIDQATAIPHDFDWTQYHTFVSVSPARNPDRTICWTPPTIDYAGEGLIISASIPVWQDDHFIGLWSIDLPLRYIYQDFALTTIFPDQEQWIADDNNMLLLHQQLQAKIDPAKGSIFLHSLADLGGDWSNLPSGFPGENHEGDLRIFDKSGIPWIAVFVRVPRVNWTLFCALPEHSLEKAATERLQNAFQQIGEGNFGHRIERSTSNALIATLTDEFNKMSRRLEEAEKERERIEKQLLQAQKMEAVGRLAGGVAHDYNNMINVIMGYTELAMESISPDDKVLGDLTQIMDAARHSMEITRQLLAFARCQPITPQVLDLNKTVSGMLKMLRRLIGEDIELIWKPAEEVWAILLDPTQIDQILANLCINARDAINGVGKVLIETCNIELDESYCATHRGFMPGQFAMLAITDDGAGMEPATMNRIFEPFFSTKAIGQGTGLGLATVYGIVKQNKGFINVYSEPEKGTTFRIYLPRAAGETTIADTPNNGLPVRGHGEVVLVVEDENAILRMTERMLLQLGYHPIAASNPKQAMEIARQHADQIKLLLTDVVMPDLNGRELSNHLRQLIPNLKVLYMSGYTANVIIHRGVLDENVCLLQKPFNKKDLAAGIMQALAR